MLERSLRVLRLDPEDPRARGEDDREEQQRDPLHRLLSNEYDSRASACTSERFSGPDDPSMPAAASHPPPDRQPIEPSAHGQSSPRPRESSGITSSSSVPTRRPHFNGKAASARAPVHRPRPKSTRRASRPRVPAHSSSSASEVRAV